MTIRRKAVVLFSILLCFVVASCQGLRVNAQADSAVPTETLQDWVTYGDFLAVAKVISEQQVPPDPEEVQRGEGTIGRKIVLQISEPAWRRPSLSPEIQLPASLTTGGGFWTFRGDHKSEVVVDGRDWLQVGQEYLMLFTNIDIEFSTNPQKPISQARPQLGPLLWMRYEKVVRSVPDVSLAPQVLFKSDVEVGAQLTATPPDPKALPYMQEDPALRYQHTYR